jgi:uncharacterized metal-binding protein
MSVPVTIISCSGISSTGQLTMKAALELRRRCASLIDEHVAASSTPERLKDALYEAERIVVLDGCEDCCGAKIVRQAGFEPDLHLIATSCGITKRGMDEPDFDEIRTFCMIIQKRLQG